MMERRKYIEGLICGSLSFILWGLLPLYWKLVGKIDPYQVFAQRVVWSFVFFCVIFAVTRRWKYFIDVIRERSNWVKILAPAVFISVNWLTYIWAVDAGYVIETSLGYYINPLLLTFFGGIFFNERLNGLQKIGFLFAAVGVILKTIFYGQIPFISLILAFSFAAYALLKKKLNWDSVISVGFETLVIGIPALIYLTFHEVSGIGITGNLPVYFWLLIALSGIATATPLILYGEGTKRLPLNVLGFLQYMSPTITLFLGIFVFKEAFDYKSLIAFSFIWVGLIIFTYSQVKLLRKPKGISEQLITEEIS